VTKTRFLAFIWIFLLFLIQNAVFSAWAGRPFPIFLVMGVVFYGLFEGPFFGLAAGLYAGIFLDVMGTGKLGAQMAILGFLGMFAGFVSTKIFRESLFTQILLTSLVSYLVNLLNLAILQIMLPDEHLSFSVIQEAFHFWELAVTAILTPPIFDILRRVSFIPKHRSSRWTQGQRELR